MDCERDYLGRRARARGRRSVATVLHDLRGSSMMISRVASEIIIVKNWVASASGSSYITLNYKRENIHFSSC